MKKKMPDAGIHFETEIRLEEDGKKKRKNGTQPDVRFFRSKMRFALLFLLILSCLAGLQEPLGLSVNWLLIVSGALLESIGLFLAFSSEKRSVKWFFIGAGLYLLAYFLLSGLLWDGMRGLADSVRAQYNNISRNRGDSFLAGGIENIKQEIALLYLTFPCFVLAAKGMVSRSRAEFLLPSLLILAGVPMSIGKMPEFWWGSIFLLCFLFVLGTQGNRTDADAETDQNAQAQSERWLVIGLGVSGLLLLCLAVPFLQERYGREKMEMRQELQEQMAEVDVLRELEENVTDWLPWKMEKDGGMSGGRLGDSDSLEYSGEEHLSVSIMSENAPSGTLYLKGYAGGVYNGRGWEEFSDGEPLSQSYLGRPGRICQLGADWSDGLLVSLSVSLGEPVTAEIVPTGGDASYTYVPEGVLAEESGLTPEQDLYWTGGNGRIVYYPLPAVLEILDDEMLEIYALRAYALEESGSQMSREEAAAYEQTVHRLYTEIPQEMERLRDWMDGVGKEDFSTLGEAIEYVRGRLWSQAEYSLEPGRTPGGEDFIEYFLFTQRKGYCVYFASASAMMFRSMGIPARYAEGYLVNTSGGEEQISVRDSSAHAWVEIYQDGLGWFPVEVTPGFAASGGGETVPQPWETEEIQETETTEEPEESQERETETVGSSPQQTQQENTVPAGGKVPEKEAEENSGISDILWGAVFTAAALFALGLFAAVRRNLIIRWRERKTRRQSPRRKLLSIYEEFCRLTAWLGRPADVETKAEEAAKKYPFLAEEEYELFRKSAEEASFSRHPVTKEQIRQAAGFYRDFRGRVEKALPAWKKLWMKYWKCF